MLRHFSSGRSRILVSNHASIIPGHNSNTIFNEKTCIKTLCIYVVVLNLLCIFCSYIDVMAMTTVMICQMKQINTVKIRHTVTVTYTIHVLTVTASYSHGNVTPSLIALTARMSLIVTVSE